jgi:hypothetical protein
MVDAQVVEDATLNARPVPGTPTPGFVAFLDGTQESRVLAWDLAAPIVVGRVAAAIRARTTRHLATWRAPIVEWRLYAPFAYTSPHPWVDYITAAATVDTSLPEPNGEPPPPHPAALLERARQAVSRDRDALELRLAETWCAAEDRPLFIDGGIGGSDKVARAPCAIGVIKSHRTLWVDRDALAIVLALRSGERSSVIRIQPRGRASVYSWYLRLRSATGHDSLWGLVRVEIAETQHITTRADQVSRWILAETVPLALPDARWDKMVYGVRNTEEFLRAIT